VDSSQLWDLVFDSIKKVVFPEEWLKLDLALSKQEVFALMLLSRRGEIIMSEIASYVNVPMSTATGIVDRLVKNGFLERNRSDSDRRVVMIKLTDKGKALAGQIKNLGTRYFEMISDALTGEERAFLFKIMTKIMGVINGESSAAPASGGNETRLTKIEIE
jgi:MarR family transcriptional regulator, organic hydroperoxide resistance regulator